VRGLHSAGCRRTGPCRSRTSRSTRSHPVPVRWRARDPAGPGHPASEQVRGRPGLRHRLAGHRAAEYRSPHRPQPGFPGPATTGGRAWAAVRHRGSRGAARHRARTKCPAAGWLAAWARLTPPASSQSVMAGDPGTARADSPRSLSISAEHVTVRKLAQHTCICYFKQNRRLLQKYYLRHGNGWFCRSPSFT